MNHPALRDLMELAIGHTTTERAEALRDHRETCPACKAQFAQHQAIWQMMGQWSDASPANNDDFTQRVLRAAKQSESADVTHARNLQSWLRRAAAVIISVSVGVLSAEWSLSDHPATAHQVAERTLVLPNFQNASPARFAESILGCWPDQSRKQTDHPSENSK